MRSGTLRQFVAILGTSEIRNASGGFYEAFIFIKGVYAEVKPLTGREFFSAKQIDANITHKIKLRYDSSLNLTNSSRIVNGSKIYNVSFVFDVDELDEEFSVYAIEQTGVKKEVVARWSTGELVTWSPNNYVTFWKV